MEDKVYKLEDVKEYVEEFTNENGNVSAKRRAAIKGTAINLLDVWARMRFDPEMIVRTKDGIAVPIAVDKRTGLTIWCNFDASITLNAPDAIPTK